MPQETRTGVACKAIFGIWDAHCMPGLIQAMLGPKELTARDLQLEGLWRFDSKNTTLVHCVVRKLGACQAALQGSHAWKRQIRHQNWPLGPYFPIQMREEYLDLYKSWENILTVFLQVGVNMNHVVDRQTPLLAFLEGYIDWFEVSKYPLLSPSEALQNWLTDLKRAGVDLQNFGKIEDCIWKRELVRRDFQAEDEENPSCHHVVGFSYGSSIADWSLWLSPKVDTFMGDFWRLVEKPVETMAGGWPC